MIRREGRLNILRFNKYDILKGTASEENGLSVKYINKSINNHSNFHTIV